MRLYTGVSAAADTEVAVQEAVRGALHHDAMLPAFAFVLCTDQHDPDKVARIVAAELGHISWAGCCTAGVFTGTQILRRGIVVGVLSGLDARFGVGLGGPVSGDARDAGRTAAAEALAALGALKVGNFRTLVVLPDALTGNAAEVIRGAADEAGAGLIWAGGGAGDNLRFVRTAQFAHGTAHSDHVVIVAIETERALAAGVRHGWRPYGPPTQVTRAEGATAIELQYEPAFDVYRRSAASRGDTVTRDRFAAFAMTHPLGFPKANGEYVIRDPLAVDENGGLRCVAEIPDGCLVRVMEGDREDLIVAGRAAAAEARDGIAGALGGALVFDCVSHYLMLGDDMDQELLAIKGGLGEAVPILGCLTFGEVGALGPSAPQFHNKTAVILALPG